MDKVLENAVAAANLHGLTDRELAAVVEAATAGRRAEQARPGRVLIVHPDMPTGLAPLLVDADAVAVYEQSGWQVKPDAEPEPDEAPDGEPPLAVVVAPDATAKPKTKPDKEN